MLTVRKLSLVQASTYYSKDNYYTHEQQGEFIGNLKNDLSLEDLTHESFVNLLEGVNPSTGESLVASKSNRKSNVPAIDFTFSPTKSISITYELALAKGDITLADAMQNAHNNAVNSALFHIEKEEIKARVQKNKVSKIHKTGNMIAAKFEHNTNRSLEPQLHTHCVVFNLTKIDGKYKAIDAADLLKKGSPIIKNLGQFYREALKHELQKAGFELRDVDKSKSFFELKNVDDNLIQAFSSRTIAIKAKVEELKKEHPNLSKSQLSLRAFFNTRQTKREVDRDEVRVKNVELMSQHVNLDKLLSSLQPRKIGVNQEIKEPQIEQAELKKLIHEAKSEIPNKKHRTPLNVTIRATAKIDTPISITSLFNQIKTEEVKQQKEFKNMHEILLHNLKSTKLDTQKLFASLKNTPDIKIQIEEKFENARGTNNRDRFITSYRDITNTIERAKQFNHRDVEQLVTTGTERGVERTHAQGDDVIESRKSSFDFTVITKDDIKRAEEGYQKQRESQNKKQGVER